MAKRILNLTENGILGGWVTVNNDTTPAEGARDQYTSSLNINPFRKNFIGHIAPGEVFDSFTDSTPQTNDLPIDLTTTSMTGTNVFVLLENQRIVFLNSGSTAIVDSRDIAHGTLTGVVGESLLSYHDGTDEYVLYSFRGTEGWDVGRFTTSTRAYDDDFMITVPTQSNDSGKSSRTSNATVPGKLWIGPDKLIYRTNGQFIAAFDPNVSTNTINYAALNLGAGWIATGGAVFGNYNLIVGYKDVQLASLSAIERGEARLWLWDGFSPEPNFVYDLEDFITGGVKVFQGQAYVFTQGLDAKTRVKIFNGSGVSTAVEYLTSSLGNLPQMGGIEIYNNMLHWHAPTIGIFALVPLGSGRFGIHQVMHPNTSTAGLTAGDTTTNSPLLKYSRSDRLVSGVNDSGTHRITRGGTTNNNYYNTARWSSRLFTLPHRSTITKINIYLSQFNAGARFTVSLFKNYNNVSVGGANDLLNRTITRAGEGAVGHVSIPCYIPNVNAFHVNINFDHSAITTEAAIIRDVYVEYDDEIGSL